jgi:hypothetical protein
MEMMTGEFTVHVSFRPSGQLLIFPAVVVWDLPDGIAWVQPGYLDPEGATTRQFRRVKGEVRRLHDSITVTNDEIDVLLMPFAMSENQRRDLARALAWYRDELQRLGLDREEEAARLHQELADDLA